MSIILSEYQTNVILDDDVHKYQTQLYTAGEDQYKLCKLESQIQIQQSVAVVDCLTINENEFKIFMQLIKKELPLYLQEIILDDQLYNQNNETLIQKVLAYDKSVTIMPFTLFQCKQQNLQNLACIKINQRIATYCLMHNQKTLYYGHLQQLKQDLQEKKENDISTRIIKDLMTPIYSDLSILAIHGIPTHIFYFWDELL